MKVYSVIARVVLLPVLGLIAGCSPAPESFSVQVERPIERVYGAYLELPSRGSMLREIGVSGIDVQVQKPADGQILYVIPAAEGQEGSQVLLSFSATKEGGTLIDATVIVPELMVASRGNMVISDDKVAEQLRIQMNRLGEAIESNQPITEQARAFNLALDAVSVLSDPALLARVERKGDLESGLFAGLDAAMNEDYAQGNIDEAADAGDAMSDPDVDAVMAQAGEPTDDAGNW